MATDTVEPTATPVAKDPKISTVDDRWYLHMRLIGLTRFAIAITFLNIAGHLFLGFEQSWATPFVALAAAYGTEMLGESLDAWADNRRPKFFGSVGSLASFLLPTHISALAVSMLLYAAEQLWAVAFAASAAIASKYVFRMTVGRATNGELIRKHFLNPSNFGITCTLLLFPLAGIAPPYQFSENTYGWVDWVLPLVVIGTGSYLNIKATGRIPLILSWVTTFALQALVRAAIDGTPWNAGLEPMTGFAFILFTFYMVTDPATSPGRMRDQIVFGAAVALAYAVIMELHIVFGLFFALAIVTAGRGLLLWVKQRLPIFGWNTVGERRSVQTSIAS
jgi:hypothetical protein